MHGHRVIRLSPGRIILGFALGAAVAVSLGPTAPAMAKTHSARATITAACDNSTYSAAVSHWTRIVSQDMNNADRARRNGSPQLSHDAKLLVESATNAENAITATNPCRQKLVKQRVSAVKAMNLCRQVGSLIATSAPASAIEATVNEATKALGAK
jgi:hypothetical protein